MWRTAAVLTGFSQFSPQDGIPAADSTQVLLWYSPTALYVGIRAFEAHGAVHATLADRDKIAADDNVQLLLGTFHDQRQAYVFAVNPFGVQMDGTIVENGLGARGGWTPTLAGRASPDLSQDFVFSRRGGSPSTATRSRSAFRSRVSSISRRTCRAGTSTSCARCSTRATRTPGRRRERANASFLAQSGTIDGLTGFDRGLVLDVNPVVTQQVNGAPAPTGGWGYAPRAPQLGGNVRWGMTNNLTLTGTAHPDFAEVESDAGQFVIDPRQALFFPEKRPFFLDGLEQFSVPHTLIYTRASRSPTRRSSSPAR